MLEGLHVEHGAVEQLHGLSEVSVGLLVRLLEVGRLVVDEEGVLEDVGGLEVAVPLLHYLVGPHVHGRRVQAEPQGLSKITVTLHIFSYVYRI